jgi:dolichyl-phosphate-mannose-protein mannosyltransferase
MNRYKAYLPEIILIGAGLAMRLAFAALPLQSLLVLLEDDAWMVAAIARHWALGHGITADGSNPTNGFHPLYPLTFGALPYLIKPNDLDFGFRANLLICAFLSSLALLPFYGLARLLAARPIALAALAVLALNPIFIRVSVNAMETSLALLLLLTLWWYALAHPPNDLRGAALLGVLAALAALARLDNLLAAGLLGVALLWRELSARRWPTLSLTYGAVAGLLLLPYFARNWLVFGAISPSSGRALAYLHSYRESFAFSSGLQLVATQPALDLSWAPIWLWLLTIVLLAMMIWRMTPQRRAMLTPLILYALALTCYYSYLQQQGQPRYYVGVGIVLMLMICAWAGGEQPTDAALHSRSTLFARRRVAQAAWLVALAAIVLNNAMFVRQFSRAARAPGLAQPAMYQAARWVATNLPPEAQLASSNSGIFQYYSDHVVLNFDGKLNHEIIPIQVRRELDSYLRAKSIGYIIDLPEVADRIIFYSRSMSEAKPHIEITAIQKILIYIQMLAHKVGLTPAVQLDELKPDRVLRPFSAVTTAVQQFPLPNDPARAVVLYQLNDSFGKQQ